MFHTFALIFYSGLFLSLLIVKSLEGQFIYIPLFSWPKEWLYLPERNTINFRYVILIPYYTLISIVFVSFMSLFVFCLISKVKTGKPPIENVIMAYKYGLSHTLTRSAVSQTFTLFPHNDYIQICYEKNSGPFGIAHGVVLTNPAVETSKAIVTGNGYNIFQARGVPNAVYISCPKLPWLSHLGTLLILRIIYPKLYKYSKKNRLSAYPVVELYRRYSITLMAPLSQQDNFVVPEAEKFIARSCPSPKTSLNLTENVVIAASKERSQPHSPSKETSRPRSLSVKVQENSVSKLVNGCKPVMRYSLRSNDVENNNFLKHSTPILLENCLTAQG